MSGRQKTLSQETSGKAGDFLFKMPSDDSKALDMRTRINSPATMKAMLYYGTLAYNLESKKAGEIKDLMERLLIAGEKGMGRAEAVETLKQNLPKRVEVDKGTDNITFA
jgi:hypothetical protein